MPDPPRRPDKLSIIVYSGAFERVHYALATAAAAAAVNIPVTLFFTMQACRAVMAKAENGGAGWTSLPSEQDGRTAVARNEDYGARGVAQFEELLSACVELGAKIMVCEMGLRAANLENEKLRSDIPIEAGGLVTFLNDASATGQMLMI